jgi:uncharacterized protein with ATP-grasp and redox domains
VIPGFVVMGRMEGAHLTLRDDLKSNSENKAIQSDPRCEECLLQLSEDVIGMVGEKARVHADHIRSETKRIMAHAKRIGWTSPETANEILRLIRGVSGIADPYETVKSKEMAQAKAVFSQVKGRMGTDLRSLTNLAVLGNSLDFFRNADEALAGVAEQAGGDLVYFHDDLDRLQAFLMNDPGLVLYLTDNSGEIFFDLPLFQHIQGLAKRAVMVVKGGPALNDLTSAELDSPAIDEMRIEIMDTGTDGAGIDWRHVSKEFASLAAAADLIVAKGMANFETLFFKRLSTPVFFLFRAKCGVVADFLKAPMDGMMALWKDNDPKTIA